MSDEIERRLRDVLSRRSADPLPGQDRLPPETRRRARNRRARNIAAAGLTAVAIVAVSMTVLVRPEPEAQFASLPPPPADRVPQPTVAITPPEPAAPRVTPGQAEVSRVAVIPDAGSKIVAHGRVWVVATTRVLAYSPAGTLRRRVVVTELFGERARLEPRVLAADSAGVWIAGVAADGEGTRRTKRCEPIGTLGEPAAGGAFAARLDANTGCPSAFVALGTVGAGSASPSPLVPTAGSSPSSSIEPAPRRVRWHGLTVAGGALWVGADGGMLRIDLRSGARRELGLDAYSVGAGFGSVWAAVVEERGTTAEDARIARLDLSTGREVASFDVEPVEGSPDFAEVFVGPDAVWAEGYGHLTQIDPTTSEIVAGYPIGGSLVTGDMAAGAGLLYLADNGEEADGFFVVDPRARKLLRKVDTQGSVSGLVLVGDRMWLSRNGALERIPV